MNNIHFMMKENGQLTNLGTLNFLKFSLKKAIFYTIPSILKGNKDFDFLNDCFLWAADFQAH